MSFGRDELASNVVDSYTTALCQHERILDLRCGKVEHRVDLTQLLYTTGTTEGLRSTACVRPG